MIMNDVVILGMFFAVLTRLVGLVVSFEFYLTFKESKFLRLVLGWFAWVIAGIVHFSSQFTTDPGIFDILIMVNFIFSSMGDIFLLVGILSYFREIPNKIFIGLNLFFIIGPILAYHLDIYLIMINIISIIRFCITSLFTLIPFLERKRFEEIMSRKTMIWFIVLVISIYVYTIVYFSLIFQGVIHAGIINAKGLFAITNDDNTNLVISITAKQLNPKIRVVAQCRETKNSEKMKNAGADSVVSTSQISGMRMVSEMIRPTVVTFLDMMLRDTNKNLRVEEISIPPSLIGKKISEFDLSKFPNTLILAIKVKAEWNYNPSHDYIIQPDSVFIMMTTPEEQSKLRKKLAI